MRCIIMANHMGDDSSKSFNDKFHKESKPKCSGYSSEELSIIREQRNILLDSIKELNSNMFKVIIAILPLIGVVLGSYIDVINEPYGPTIRFAILELILVLSMVICACLFAANINRDYISAIDSYTYDKYGISVFLYEGKPSMMHLTGMKGTFPLMTLLIGGSVATNIIILSSYIIISDMSFYQDKIYLLVLFLIQVIVFALIIATNFKRKISQKSKIIDDCLKYLYRTENEAENDTDNCKKE